VGRWNLNLPKIEKLKNLDCLMIRPEGVVLTRVKITLQRVIFYKT